MALTWQAIDVGSDPLEVELLGDPASMVDALGELLAVSIRPPWMRDAKCRGRSELFFLERGESSEPAKALCSGCPVAPQCSEAGMNERHGIWGGYSERQRRTLRRTAA